MHHTQNRRQFLKTTGALSAGLTVQHAFSDSRTSIEKPSNILMIITDHSAQQSIGAYGNQHADTPHIDSLAQKGVRISQAYTNCPLCQPSRASFWTGSLPHITNVRSNEHEEHIADGLPTLGDLFTRAGYDTYHAGKTHDAGSLSGFEFVEPVEERDAPDDAFSAIYNYDTRCDAYAVPRMVEFIHKPRKKPFLAVLDLHNPHNICNYVGVNRHNGAIPNKPEIPPEKIPPLPDNFKVNDMETRPIPVQFLCCSHPRLEQGANWSRENYRHYQAAFNHFTTLADTDIGRAIQALKETGQFENTLIVYFADHGDGLGAHGMLTKHLSFYEESTRIPLIFSGPGVLNNNTAIDTELISLIDLMPTLCDYAGIETPENLPGRSILPLLKGRSVHWQRSYVVSQWEKEYNQMHVSDDYARDQKQATSPGRMLRTAQYKYIIYLEGHGEEMYDLLNDPGEQNNIINHPDHADAVKKHRSLFSAYLAESGDDFLSREVNVDPGFRRRHRPGYQHHDAPFSASEKKG